MISKLICEKTLIKILLIQQFRKISMFSLLSVVLLAACVPSPETKATQTAAGLTATAASWTETPTFTVTVTPTPTPTVTLTPTPTPPSAFVALHYPNNFNMIFQDGTWVVKSIAGKITARWNGVEWVYMEENIEHRYRLIWWDASYYNFDTTSLYNGIDTLMQQPIPDVVPQWRFVDNDGNPMSFGPFTEVQVEWIVPSAGGSAFIPHTLTIVRNRGAFIDGDGLFTVFDIPVGLDWAVVLINISPPKGGSLVAGLSDNKAFSCDLNYSPYIEMTEEWDEYFNHTMLGQQMIIGFITGDMIAPKTDTQIGDSVHLRSFVGQSILESLRTWNTLIPPFVNEVWFTGFVSEIICVPELTLEHNP